MKRIIFSIAAAVFFTSGAANAAMSPQPMRSDNSIVSVQLVCSNMNCHDPRTGYYTYSGCNYRGCYPTSGFIGRLPGYGDGYGPPPQNYGYRRQRQYYSY